MSIEIRDIGKRFGSFVALHDVSLHIPTGELVALLGPSGCGKTTLLRIIAGMETADSGQVLFAGEEATHVHARDRNVGFVFQHYALFRHMSVFENVAFGLRVKPRRLRPAEAEIRRRVSDLLQLVQLEWLADRYPAQLSGGQRQRIALARALAVEPRVLPLDEPFGALDTKVRKELRRWLRRLHDEMHISSVFVTHDQEEALEVADRVVVMNQGRVEQIGSPDEVYTNPASPFVYQFLGNVNVFHSRVHGVWAEVGREHTAAVSAGEATAFVRPHDIEIEHRPVAGSLQATVQEVHAIGPLVRVELAHDSELIEVELTRERADVLALAEGQQVWLKPRQLRVFATPPPLLEEGGSGI
ncbi:MAG TPA: sulfate ABC transporter ATP-binding protein [Candidatus Accumulibacter phosphatis]|nr:MAG: Sulfate/thiosulfate import ATP-binding protein CysA [Candidatus Accumulibacter sp. SK-11]HAY26088.1 sulfate ABC transporter ATP-binding protein [Accumulibacter sp.]HCN66894.1 sulfate ABC transporter ATP-binding protein [Accumulibacter sp.]HRL75555.1 sulfate ABC transporter ATP-binding protein [Candidatus Accumulibacter phosphatis]HRQ93812.1 sulfate ABC transporter ATP-binding protein [Candidatus Accumulibacter phosphatis]